MGHERALRFPALQKFIPLDQIQRDRWGVVRIDPDPGGEYRSAWMPKRQKHSPQIQPEKHTADEKSRLQILEICLE